MNSASPIAIFDSGVGGLTVFQTLSKMLPHENYFYLADNKRVPYGGLTTETIVQYTSEAVSFLEKQGVKLVVLGCHTASSCFLFQKRFKVPVIGMVQGVLKKMEEMSNCRKVAVLGTVRTIQSKVYERLILAQNPTCEVISIACPLLVPMIESGLFTHPDTESLVRAYLEPLQKEKVDAVLLGCTHYPLIRKVIQKVLGEEVLLIDSSDKTAIEVKDYLMGKDLLNNEIKPNVRFCVTDAPEIFAKRAALFLGKEIESELIFDLPFMKFAEL